MLLTHASLDVVAIPAACSRAKSTRCFTLPIASQQAANMKVLIVPPNRKHHVRLRQEAETFGFSRVVVPFTRKNRSAARGKRGSGTGQARSAKAPSAESARVGGVAGANIEVVECRQVVSVGPLRKTEIAGQARVYV